MNTSVATHLPGGFSALAFRSTETRPSSAAIVWLHGVGERGNDLNRVAKYGLPAAIAEGCLQTTADFFCPQLELDREWESSRLAELMADVRRQYAGAALLGFSLGALGVCEVLEELGAQADLHIAIAPRMLRLPFVTQVGTHLLTVSGEHDVWPISGEYCRQLQKLGARVDEVVLPNEGHFISESALWHPSSLSALRTVGIELALRCSPFLTLFSTFIQYGISATNAHDCGNRCMLWWRT